MNQNMMRQSNKKIMKENFKMVDKMMTRKDSYNLMIMWKENMQMGTGQVEMQCEKRSRQ